VRSTEVSVGRAALRKFHAAQFPALLPINTTAGTGIVDHFDVFSQGSFVEPSIGQRGSCAATTPGLHMKIIVATAIVLLSLSSVAEAHRLSGSATYYGGSDRLCGRRTASGAVLNCGAMTAAHRTLPFGTVLSVQSGGRSIQVTVTDRGPFSRAFLDLSPAAASALGCRCTHPNVTATVVQLGSGGTVVAGRSHQPPDVVAAVTPLFQPSEGVLGPLAMFGSTMAMAPATVHQRRYRIRR
jgi:rare lipoprotein A (peptidoglycan hydrolase)